MPQNVTAVLSEALGRTGASAVPYAAEFRFLVQQHVTDLVGDLPSLHVKTREYVHTDGRTAQLLLAEGTLPMYYQGHKYNIPVAIWLPEQYPLAAPLAYVVPTADMVIKPRHGFVDASGLVHTPYISQWQYPSANLRDMAQDMSMHFGGDPPLFSKPKDWNAGASSGTGPAPVQPSRPAAPRPYAVVGGGAGAGPADDTLHVHNPLAQAGPSFGQLSGSTFSSVPAKPAPSSAGSDATGASGGLAPGGFESVWAAMMVASGSQEQQAPSGQPPPPPPPPPRENPSTKLGAVFRTAAVAALNKRVQASLAAVAHRVTAQAGEQLELQATLKQRGEQLQAEVAALQAERVALDKLSQELAASSAQLDRWLADNEHLAKAAEDPSQLDPDVVISAADPLSQQALEAQAQDLALEDALYALDKALNQGVIEADAYLKQVRAVCVRQFFVRVCGAKVATAQQDQQQQAPGPPQQHRQPQPHDVQRTLSAGRPVVLPQGDSWANAGILSGREPPPGTWYPAT